jgi:hypothetical protein
MMGKLRLHHFLTPTENQVYEVTHECIVIRMAEKGIKTDYPEVTAEYHLS